MSQVPETNPEIVAKGPLPAGWVTEYSPQWNAWFYVDTKAPNPQAVWTHPLDTNANPSPAYTAEPGAGHATTSAPSNPSAAAASPGSAGHPTNPDTRPLPPGWVSQYSPDHKIFFYVNETAADPGSTVTWKHPADEHHPPTDAKSPVTAVTQAHSDPTMPIAPGAAAKVGSDAPHQTAVAAAPAPGINTHGGANPPGTSQKENSDKRPLPPNWITKFDENYGVWYYVDTSKPGNAASWEHPADIKTGPTSTAAPSTPGVSGDHNTQAYGSANPAAGGQGYQQHAEQAPPAGGAGGKGLEGLLGGSAGKMVGGLFGAKGKAQMDMFANKIAPEMNKLKNKYAAPSSGAAHGQQGQGQYSTPPGQQTQGQYGAPPAQYGGPPGQPQGQYTPGASPGQPPHGQYTPAPGGPGTAPPGQAPGQQQYTPEAVQPPSSGYGGAPGYGAPPAGQPPQGGSSGGGSHGGFGGAQLNQLTGLAGKFGFGKK